MNISLERKVDLLQLELEDQEQLDQYGCGDARRDAALIRPGKDGADMTLIIAALQDIASRIDNLENLVHSHNQILMESRALSRNHICPYPAGPPPPCPILIPSGYHIIALTDIGPLNRPYRV